MPERAFPGKFDFLASSHQLFHTAVVLAASVQFYGLLKAYEFQHAHLQVYALLSHHCTQLIHARVETE